MADILKKNKLPKISAGTLRAFIFIFLVGIAIAFWLYTQLIIGHVREFQKLIITTQKEIYVGIIKPLFSEALSIDSELYDELFIKGVIDSPFPSIFSDENNNPIPSLWRNVGIMPNDRSEASTRKLKNIIQKMDMTNPPDTVFTPKLIPRTDTLTVYEIPPSDSLPVAVTDMIGTLLYWRNITAGPVDSLKIMNILNELDTNPERFSKDNEPPLIFYGLSEQDRWPVIVTKKNDNPLYWRDVGLAWNDTSSSGMERLKYRIKLMSQGGVVYDIVTSNITGYNIMLFHYGDPKFLSWIVWLPVIEFLVIFILIVIGFIGFRNITKAEQRSIWVGMAKETAHQLGTPISSIDGWLELLKAEHNVSLVDQAVNEIEYDVKRLTRVAARFSNVGSKPELQPIDVSEIIDEVLDYFRSRVPNMRTSVVLESQYKNLSQIMGNHELLNWAFENLIKNSLASIENKDGSIAVSGMMSKDFKHVILDFQDNGKGISHSDQKKIMKPGYTTKSRGWGLGLSLVKRIIEDYHGGKVILLESKPGPGSIFRVILPAVKS